MWNIRKIKLWIASKLIDSCVEWEFCDCGCPNQRSPKNEEAANLLKLAARIRVDYL